MDKELEFQQENDRIIKLLEMQNVDSKKIKVLMPIIENTAWMKVKLDEARLAVKNSQVVISYDNGGGQKGIRENPLFKGYEALWKSYMAGMNVILNALPNDIAEKEKSNATEVKTMLEVVRGKHKKEA